jgi:hypothetical protein
MAASMKIAVFTVVALCSQVELTYFSEVLAASIIRAICKEAGSNTLEMSVNFNKLYGAII